MKRLELLTKELLAPRKAKSIFELPNQDLLNKALEVIKLLDLDRDYFRNSNTEKRSIMNTIAFCEEYAPNNLNYLDNDLDYGRVVDYLTKLNKGV